MREQPASVINTRQTFHHVGGLEPGPRKDEEGVGSMHRALQLLTRVTSAVSDTEWGQSTSSLLAKREGQEERREEQGGRELSEEVRP